MNKIETKSIYERIARAFRVSVPIVSLETSDPALSIQKIGGEILGVAPAATVLKWDCVAGVRSVAGEVAKEAAKQLDGVYNLTELLMKLAEGSMDDGTVMIVQNSQRYIDGTTEMQSLWNCRDVLKARQQMIVLLGVGINLPIELQHDVLQFVEPLPDQDQLAEIIGSVAKDASVTVDPDAVADAAKASLGVSGFLAENMAALNMSKAGINVDGVWKAKAKKINATPGLRIADSASFDEIGGVQQVKKFLTGVLRGNDAPNAIVFVDEIEKFLGGSQHDTSGVGQDQLGTLLGWMQDKRATGCIFNGPPGAAKSVVAKAAGATANIPTIQFDLGGMKGSLVGQSEQQIREALKVIDAVSGGKTLWIATCNSMTAIPPELKRRFKLGTWFFDLPNAEERSVIWSIYIARYGMTISDEDLAAVVAKEWTGAEIEACCEIAWRIQVSLTEAAEYIVPVSIAARESIDALRNGAEGRYLSASAPGPYARQQAAGRRGRKID